MRLWSLLLLGACAAPPLPPEVRPAQTGANVASLDGARAAAADPRRSAALYAAVLGGRVSDEGTTCLVLVDGLAAPLVFEPRSGPASPPTAVGFEVLDLDRALVELAVRGIAFTLVEDGTGDRAVFFDPDGRQVTLGSQHSPAAADRG
jgi:hypothetical protein